MSGNRRPTRLAYVDDREARQHQFWVTDEPLLPGTLAHEGFTVETGRKDYGDIWIQLTAEAGSNPFDMRRWLVVETKTWDDLHQTLRDSGEGRDQSRVRHQLEGLIALRQRGLQVCVMTIGVMTPAGGKNRGKGVYVQNKGARQFRNWSWYELEQALAAFQRLGIVVYHAPSEAEVPHSLRMLAELCERPGHFEDHGLAPVAHLSPRLGHLATALTSVVGVGRELALSIGDRYGTFAQFYHRGDVSDLQQIPGVGKVLAQRIHAAFHDMDSDPEMTVDEIEQRFLFQQLPKTKKARVKR